MPPRARSESPLVGEHWNLDNGSTRTESHLLFSATSARKRAEQDSLLLANRIRLLKAEEEKTRKRIRETERKTQEILDLRRKNEERRLAREATDLQREAAEKELRERQLREREETQQKILAKQQALLDHKASICIATRQEREVHKLSVEEQRAAKLNEVMAKRDRVRSSLQGASRSRARSEKAKQELAREVVSERMKREDVEQRTLADEIARMEEEESSLLLRLQESQEQHRAAFLRLEDALRSGGTCPASASAQASREDRTPATHLAAPSSSTAFIDLMPTKSDSLQPLQPPRHIAVGSCSRPPRPRGPSVMEPSISSDCAASSACSMKGTLRRLVALQEGVSSISSCSTTSCAESCSGMASGTSTPLAASAVQLTYTTVDGTELSIPAEEDLDLVGLLNG